MSTSEATSLTVGQKNLILGLKIVFGCYLVSLVTSMSGMEIFSSLLILGTVIAVVWIRPKPLIVPPFWKPLVLFILIIIIGVLINEVPFNEKLKDARQIRILLFYFVLFYYLKYFLHDMPWIKVMVIACLIVGIYGFIQHFIPLDLVRPEGKRIYLFAIQDEKIGPLIIGTFNHHLTFSNIFIFYACLFFGIGLKEFSRQWFFLFIGTLLYVCCVWTQSRVGWVAIPITLLFLCWGKSKRAFWICCVVLIFAGVAFYFVDEGFRARLDRTVFQEDDFYNLGPRSRLWKANFQMFKDHAWVGVGYNNNERRSKEYLERLFPEQKDHFGGHAHFTLLQIITTTGVIGLLCYVALWWQIMLKAWRLTNTYALSDMKRWMFLGILAGMIGFHIQGLTQWNFGDAEVLHNVIFFWALTALYDVPKSPFESSAAKK